MNREALLLEMYITKQERFDQYEQEKGIGDYENFYGFVSEVLDEFLEIDNENPKDMSLLDVINTEVFDEAFNRVAQRRS